MAEETDLDRQIKEAELRQTLAEARKAEAEAEQTEIDLEHDRWCNQRRYSEAAEKDAQMEKCGVYYFNTDVRGTTVESCREWLHQHVTLRPGEPIKIIINSPGGSVLDGFDLFDAIREASDAGCHVTTVIAGVAASMGGILAQAGDVRVIGKRSWLHLHEVSTAAIGKASDLEDAASLAKRLTEQAAEVYEERSGVKTKAQIMRMMTRHEVWLTPDEALAAGFVDEVQ